MKLISFLVCLVRLKWSWVGVLVMTVIGLSTKSYSVEYDQVADASLCENVDTFFTTSDAELCLQKISKRALSTNEVKLCSLPLAEWNGSKFILECLELVVRDRPPETVLLACTLINNSFGSQALVECLKSLKGKNFLDKRAITSCQKSLDWKNFEQAKLCLMRVSMDQDLIKKRQQIDKNKTFQRLKILKKSKLSDKKKTKKIKPLLPSPKVPAPIETPSVKKAA